MSASLSLIDVGARDIDAPLTHIVLAGLFGAARRLMGALDGEWAKASSSKAGSDERERWERDRVLLSVAETAREKRTEAAWTRLSST